jgi:RNA polymerase sigma-70 factor (ECF subfamily)
MLRIVAGDTVAFGQFVDRHAARALAVATAVCHNRQRAEDAVQESLLAIWRSRADYSPAKGSVQAWAMSIVRHRAIDLVRRDGALRRAEAPVAHSEDVARAPGSVHEEAVVRSECRVLAALLHQLPRPQAEVIALAYSGGLSHREIAEQLALPQGTVKGRMRLGLDKLREGMSPMRAEFERVA